MQKTCIFGEKSLLLTSTTFDQQYLNTRRGWLKLMPKVETSRGHMSTSVMQKLDVMVCISTSMYGLVVMLTIPRSKVHFPIVV
jgi:hypothetical protein